MKKFYLTTPLYYVNAVPHVGHAYTTIAADILARYKRSRGEAVHFLTGTDEHGAKIEAAAREAGKPPLAFADEVTAEYRSLWRDLGITHDDFIRTTEDRHKARVQGVFERLLKTGDIAPGLYRGWYCLSDESYWTETEAPGDEKGRRLCPNPECRKPLRYMEEESYFFRLSKYAPRLLEHFKSHPEFLQPAHRAGEMVRFVEAGLRDLAATRTKVSWGVGVPSAPGHSVYVWFDALLNYVTAAGYDPSGRAEGFESLWPADVHLMGKEIFRFHTVIWPAMLMALDLPLPRTVFAHGWWTVEGQKMSKSKGNFLDPREFSREFGVDALRYFLFREMPFGNDGDFSREAFRRRYNSELANDLGNLLSRVCQMAEKYLGGTLPERGATGLSREILASGEAVASAMDRLAFQEALNLVWAAVRGLNESVDRERPWEKSKTDPARVADLLFDWVHGLRAISVWISPFMPEASRAMQEALGMKEVPAGWDSPELAAGPSRAAVRKGPSLFPRKA
jgi:methionyl-tRNA synthetase